MSAENQVEERIPVIVIGFNLVTYVRNTVRQLLNLKVDPSDILILDNHSTYGPMIDYLAEAEKIGVRVKRFDQNMGHRVLWKRPEVIDEFFPDCRAFVLTDPDLQFHPDMPTTFRQDFWRIMKCIQELIPVYVVGMALDLSDQENFKTWPAPYYYHNFKPLPEWESQFWRQEVDLEQSGLKIGCPKGCAVGTCEACAWPPKVYMTQIDTTFGLYDRATWTLLTGPRNDGTFRVAGRYVAKHLPWYDSTKTDFVRPSNEEQTFYASIARADSSSSVNADRVAVRSEQTQRQANTIRSIVQ